MPLRLRRGGALYRLVTPHDRDRDLGGVLVLASAAIPRDRPSAADILVRLPGAVDGQFLCGRGSVSWDDVAFVASLDPSSRLPACGSGTGMNGSVTYCADAANQTCPGDRASTVRSGLVGYEADISDLELDDVLVGGQVGGVISFRFPGFVGVAHAGQPQEGFALLDDGTVVCFRGVVFQSAGPQPAKISLELSAFERIGRCADVRPQAGDTADVCVGRAP